MAEGRNEQPTAVTLDSRTLHSTSESGGRAGYDGGKRKKGSKVQLAVAPLGHLLGLLMTPASEQDRAQVQELAQLFQQITAETVEIAFVERGYTGEQAAQDAATEGIQLEVVNLPEASSGICFATASVGGRAKFCEGRGGSDA